MTNCSTASPRGLRSIRQRVTIELDLADPGTGRAPRLVVSACHRAQPRDDGDDRATIEADVPRRLLPLVGIGEAAVAERRHRA